MHANIRAISILVALLGAGVLVLLSIKLKPGMGSYSLKAVGITLVATLTALISLFSQDAITGAIGVFGAIAGYLFGNDQTDEGKKKGVKERLLELKKLLQGELISTEEYAAKRQEILKDL